MVHSLHNLRNLYFRCSLAQNWRTLSRWNSQANEEEVIKRRVVTSEGKHQIRMSSDPKSSRFPEIVCSKSPKGSAAAIVQVTVWSVAICGKWSWNSSILTPTSCRALKTQKIAIISFPTLQLTPINHSTSSAGEVPLHSSSMLALMQHVSAAWELQALAVHQPQTCHPKESSVLKLSKLFKGNQRGRILPIPSPTRFQIKGLKVYEDKRARLLRQNDPIPSFESLWIPNVFRFGIILSTFSLSINSLNHFKWLQILEKQQYHHHPPFCIQRIREKVIPGIFKCLSCGICQISVGRDTGQSMEMKEDTWKSRGWHK